MKQRHLPERERVNLGSYYTPAECVRIVEELLAPHLGEDTVLLDNACGYGSFLGNACAKTVIGVDIDAYAVSRAKSLHPRATILHRNALADVGREPLGISQSCRLAIVGNPPYNDRTSHIRNRIKQAPGEVDGHLRRRDLGLSFLLSYARLCADVVCVLHPLSYLIKRANFATLREFARCYRLQEGILIDSGLFHDNSTATQFPIVIALYARSSQGMSYETVTRFPFRTTAGRTLRLSDYDFIPRYVNKYPRKHAIVTRDSLFFFPMRDINALKRNRTFIQYYRPNLIVIDKRKLDYYIYIDVFKRHLTRLPYYYGNCDVFIDRKLFTEYRSAFVADAVRHHPFLERHVEAAPDTSLEVAGYFDALLSERRYDEAMSGPDACP